MSAATDRWMLCAIRDGVPAFALFGSKANADSFTRLHDGRAIKTEPAGFALTDKGRELLRALNEPTTPQPRAAEPVVAGIDATNRLARGER